MQASSSCPAGLGQGLGFRLRVEALGFRVQGRLRVEGSGFRVQGLGLRIFDSGLATERVVLRAAKQGCEGIRFATE